MMQKPEENNETGELTFKEMQIITHDNRISKTSISIWDALALLLQS
jgi:hypothetical protein